MDPKKFIETDTDLQAAQCREWLGREYCRANGATVYPMPPDTWPGMHDSPPRAPPANSYTLYYVDPFQKIGGGGVFELDEDLVAFGAGGNSALEGLGAATPQAQTLSDGASYSFDIAAGTKLLAQLSSAGQAAVAGPP